MRSYGPKAAPFEHFGAAGGVPSTRFVRDGVFWRLNSSELRSMTTRSQQLGLLIAASLLVAYVLWRVTQ
jgi:hypothetical protein